MSLLELGGAGKDGRGFREAIGFAVGEKEFVDAGGISLVPNLVEPALDELLIGVAHSSSGGRKGSTGIPNAREMAEIRRV